MTDAAPPEDTSSAKTGGGDGGGDDLLAELVDDFLRRHRAGEHPSPDEYTSKHPELADRILELFPVMLTMEQRGAGATLEAGPDTERAGTTIGRYKLLERIGEGGFGIVYMAEQLSPVRRKVAVKVIKPGYDTHQVIARFEAERQALALMDHENIAKVLDAGATESGRPYFVMELVHGVPITDYCDRNELSPRERLELFVQVCRAVQHAHTKGIIHRDIKPTNVLVTLHEGVAVPKVIDFGVAKATGQQLTEKTLFTHFAQMVGTPLYMSPEQAEMTGVDVDTRSDVYSLGVLLYELLTGTTPLDKDRLKRSAFDEIRRIIREEEPPRPSTRLSTLGDEAKTISARRKSDPTQLGRLIRGELDWIVMKSLEKARQRRYETANGLARDIERYLNDDPVEACPPSNAYRLRKFARRHRVGLLAGSAAVLAFLVLLVVLSVSNHMIARESDRKEAALRGEHQALALAQRRGDEAAKNLVLARENERTAQHALYAARINLAQQAAESAEVERMVELLDSLRPEAGQEDLRGFEWYYLWGLCHDELLTLQEFTSPVRTAVFSPDGKTFAAGHGAEVKLFSSSGEPLATLPAAMNRIRAAAFSPNGALLAVGGGPDEGKGEVQVWDVAARTPKLVLPPLEEPVSSVTFSPDGKTFATSTAAFVVEHDFPTVAVKPGPAADRVRLWDVESGKALGSFEGRTASVLTLAFSPDGKFVVGGTADSQVIVWQSDTFRKQAVVPSDGGYVSAVVFSPDGNMLVTGSGNWYRPGRLALFAFPSMQPANTVSGFNRGITSLAFSPDGKVIAAGTHEREVYLFSSAGQELGRLLGHRDFVSSVAFSPDGRKLASSSWDNTVRIWDAAKSLREARVLKAGLGAAFLPDGRFVTNSNPLTVADRAAPTTRHAQEELASDSNVALSPDGRLIAAGDNDGHVMVWDSSTLARLHDFQDGKRIWCVSFSPDSHILASAGDNNKVTLRDVSDGRVIRVFQPKGNRARSVTFAPDGRHLATSTADNGSTVQIWDLVSGEAGPPLDGFGASSVRFSPDGKLLAVARESPELYDVDTGRGVQTFRGHSGNVWDIAFSPDGKRLASIGWDRTVRLWSVSNSQLLLTLKFAAPGFGVAFSPDGRTLAAAAWRVHFWDAADPVEVDEHIESVLNRIDALRRAGQIAEAEQFAARMLERYRQRWGESHSWTARLMVERASLLTQRGDASRYPEAETLLVNGRKELGRTLIPGHEWRWRALYVARDLYGPGAMNDPDKLAEILTAMGYKSDRPSTSPAATTPTQPSDEFLDHLNHEAYIARRDGHLEQARALRARVLDGANRLYARGDARLVKYQYDYVQLLIQMQRYEEAETVAGDALKSLSLEETTSRLMVLRTLANLYGQWKKPDEAERYRKLVNSAEAATRPTTLQAR